MSEALVAFPLTDPGDTPNSYETMIINGFRSIGYNVTFQKGGSSSQFLSKYPSSESVYFWAHSGLGDIAFQGSDILSTGEMYDVLEGITPPKLIIAQGCNVGRFVGIDFWSHVFTKDLQGSFMVSHFTYGSPKYAWMPAFFSAIKNGLSYRAAYDQACRVEPFESLEMMYYEGTRPVGSPPLPRPSNKVLDLSATNGYIELSDVEPQFSLGFTGAGLPTQTYSTPASHRTYHNADNVPGLIYHLKATPDLGYKFASWGGVRSDHTLHNPITIVVREDLHITANFVPEDGQYTPVTDLKLGDLLQKTGLTNPNTWKVVTIDSSPHPIDLVWLWYNDMDRVVNGLRFPDDRGMASINSQGWWRTSNEDITANYVKIGEITPPPPQPNGGGFDISELLPMPPTEGPPLPRIMNVYWPWYKTTA